MSHPQPAMNQPPRGYSPPQSSPSPGASAAGFPPAKRVRYSPQPSSQPSSQPQSPYAGSFVGSPGNASPALGTPNAGMTSPTGNFPHIPPPGSYHHPQQNDRQNSLGLSLPTPSAPPAASPPTASNAQPALSPGASYSNGTFAPIQAPPPNPPTTPATMPPPTINTSAYAAPTETARQPTKLPTKGSTYEYDDTLAGTGINLEEEELYMANGFERRDGFATYPAGTRGTFYGAGFANQDPEKVPTRSQEELAAEAGDRAWNEAAARLASARAHELKDNFLSPAVLHMRLKTATKKHNLEINCETKPGGNQTMGRLAQVDGNAKPEVGVRVKQNSYGTFVNTYGSFIPKDAYLADQIMLLSIATKERLRGMLDDANRIATTRQQTAHGVVPPAWVDAAVTPHSAANGTASPGENSQAGLESATSPRTGKRKRPADEPHNGLPTPISEASPPNPVVESIIGIGKEMRSVEEARLKKRQKRSENSDTQNKKDDGTASRAASVAPGTPGSVAPEPEARPPTKKESKKAAKMAEVASSSTVNATLSHFSGKKGKKYSWMTSASEASTPRPSISGAASTPLGTAATMNRAARGPLTTASAKQLGQFREDSERGRNIQLRDWISVLEDGGTDLMPLQKAYMKLDSSDMGDKVATEKSAEVPASQASSSQ